MEIKQTINQFLEWVLYVLIFYYVLFVVAASAGLFIQGIELNSLSVIIFVLAAFIISGAAANKIHKKITLIFLKLSFANRVIVSLASIIILLGTLPVFIELLPSRA